MANGTVCLARVGIAAAIGFMMFHSILVNQLDGYYTAYSEEPAATEQQDIATQTFGVGDRVILQYDARNDADIRQPFTLIAQILDGNGYAQGIFWASELVQPHKSEKLRLGWVPDNAGNYTAQLFVWKSIRDELPTALGPVKVISINVLDKNNAGEQIEISADRFVGHPSNSRPITLNMGSYEENIPVFLDFKNTTGDVYLTAFSLHNSLHAELTPAVFHASLGHKAVTNLYLENFGLHLNDFVTIEAHDSQGNLLGINHIQTMMAAPWLFDNQYFNYNSSMIKVQRGGSSQPIGGFLSYFSSDIVQNTTSFDGNFRLINTTTNEEVLQPNWLKVSSQIINITDSKIRPNHKDMHFSFRVDVANDVQAGKYAIIVDLKSRPENPNVAFQQIPLLLHVLDGERADNRTIDRYADEQPADLVLVSPLWTGMGSDDRINLSSGLDRAIGDFQAYVYSAKDRDNLTLSVLMPGSFVGKALPDDTFSIKAGEVKNFTIRIASLHSPEGVSHNWQPGYSLRLKLEEGNNTGNHLEVSVYRNVRPNLVASINTISGSTAFAELYPSWVELSPGESVVLFNKLQSQKRFNETVSVNFDLQMFDLERKEIRPLPEWLNATINPASLHLIANTPNFDTISEINISISPDAPPGTHILALQTNANSTNVNYPEQSRSAHTSGLKGILLNVTAPRQSIINASDAINHSDVKMPDAIVIQPVTVGSEDKQEDVGILVHTYRDIKNASLNIVYGKQLVVKSMKLVEGEQYYTGTDPIQLQFYDDANTVAIKCYDDCNKLVNPGYIALGDLKKGSHLIFSIDLRLSTEVTTKPYDMQSFLDYSDSQGQEKRTGIDWANFDTGNRERTAQMLDKLE